MFKFFCDNDVFFKLFKFFEVVDYFVVIVRFFFDIMFCMRLIFNIIRLI